MALEGHEVASRGLTGKTFPLAPNNAIMAQVREASNILHNITGKQTYYIILLFSLVLFSSFLSFFRLSCLFFLFTASNFLIFVFSSFNFLFLFFYRFYYAVFNFLNSIILIQMVRYIFFIQ